MRAKHDWRTRCECEITAEAFYHPSVLFCQNGLDYNLQVKNGFRPVVLRQFMYGRDSMRWGKSGIEI